MTTSRCSQPDCDFVATVRPGGDSRIGNPQVRRAGAASAEKLIAGPRVRHAGIRPLLIAGCVCAMLLGSVSGCATSGRSGLWPHSAALCRDADCTHANCSGTPPRTGQSGQALPAAPYEETQSVLDARLSPDGGQIESEQDVLLHRRAVIDEQQRGGMAEARRLLAERLRDQPDDVWSVERLTVVARDAGDARLEQAALLRLLVLQPASARAQNTAGSRLVQLAATAPPVASATADQSSQPESITSAASTRAVGVQADDVRAGHVPSDVVSADAEPGHAADLFETGLAALQRAVALEPRNPDYVQDLIGVLFTHGRYAEAETVISESLRRNPRNPVLPMTAARFYEAQNRWAEAIFYYDLALRNEPENPIWRRQRAMCLYRQGRYAEARDDFSLALRQTPAEPQMTEFLAWADSCRRTGQYADAEFVLERIVAESSTPSPDIECLRAQCRLDQRRFGDASELTASALARWPRDPELNRLAGRIRSDQTAFLQTLGPLAAALPVAAESVAARPGEARSNSAPAAVEHAAVEHAATASPVGESPNDIPELSEGDSPGADVLPSQPAPLPVPAVPGIDADYFIWQGLD